MTGIKRLQLFITLNLVVACSVSPLHSPSQPKVVGGEVVNSAYPFFVGIFHSPSGEFVCGGSYIAQNIVLTAAHCVSHPSQELSVAIGIVDKEAQRKNLPVAGVVLHPQYDSRNKSSDIALLFLDPNAAAPAEGFIELNPNSQFPGPADTVRAIGFGNLTSIGLLSDSRLRQVDLDIIIPDQEGVDQETRLHAAGLAGGKDTCQGDSGGPLFSHSDGEMKLVGITSAGRGCAQQGRPAVYTRVSYHTSWIQQVIESHETEVKNLAEVKEPQEIQNLVNKYCYKRNDPNVVRLESENGIVQKSTLHRPTGTFEISDHAARLFAATPPEKFSNRCAFTTKSGGAMELFELISSPDSIQHSSARYFLRSEDGTVAMTVDSAVDHEAVTMNKLESKYTFENCPLDDAFSIVDAEYDTKEQKFHLLTEEGYYQADATMMPPSYSLMERPVSCGAEGYELKIFEAPEQKPTWVRMLLGINSSPLWFALRDAPIHPIDIEVSLTPTVDPRESILKMKNKSETDLYTWELICPYSYSLRDSHGAIFQSTASADRRTHKIRFEYPQHPLAELQGKQSLEFTLIKDPATDHPVPGSLPCVLNKVFFVKVIEAQP